MSDERKATRPPHRYLLLDETSRSAGTFTSYNAAARKSREFPQAAGSWQIIEVGWEPIEINRWPVR